VADGERFELPRDLLVVAELLALRSVSFVARSREIVESALRRI
jgi:hypothetical protein